MSLDRIQIGHVIVAWGMALAFSFLPTGDSVNDLLWRFTMGSMFAVGGVFATREWRRTR